MATIQIADKPTLDAVKALLENSGGVKGYSEVLFKSGPGQNNQVKITGKGKVVLGAYFAIVSIDGVANNANFINAGEATYTFENEITIKQTQSASNGNNYIVYLV